MLRRQNSKESIKGVKVKGVYVEITRDQAEAAMIRRLLVKT